MTGFWTPTKLQILKYTQKSDNRRRMLKSNTYPLTPVKPPVELNTENQSADDQQTTTKTTTTDITMAPTATRLLASARSLHPPQQSAKRPPRPSACVRLSQHRCNNNPVNG